MAAPRRPDVSIPAGDYRIDPSLSSVEFVTRHFFNLGRVSGRVSVIDGQIRVADPLRESFVTARMAASSFNSGIGLRDWQVRSPFFLHARKHPYITFESTALVQAAPDVWMIRGLLTARGGAAPVTLRVARGDYADGHGLAITAEGRVDRYAHGVRLMKGFAARHLDISVTVHARKI
ncbi:YceI family protein [Plantactinospora sp. KLBMP9567]|uniref:YceI family protein n=1 Tax=Plantactinospora sp. KLBMP9567 TaxID=3085900 RepID=UPI002980B28A|nr:YceI family protein [Plantactinospora sp. KLBMP9567]MDW5329931.1 YceI family protein [Plantactinospora sp. KLBMP9567]